MPDGAYLYATTDLATIVDTCLAKDRDDRYPVMESLELDLRSFLQGRRIMAIFFAESALLAVGGILIRREEAGLFGTEAQGDRVADTQEDVHDAAP